ncbi:MAG: MFS transporter [Chlamydiales bacterium]|nr:MFS transporter [Chlamydiales bacterium]
MSSKRTFTVYGCFVWGLSILFFFYEFFLRVLPGTMAANIINNLDLTVEQFSLIGSGYYITYSLMQIPVGMLLDRFAIRFLVTGACALCAFGTFWFSIAQSSTPAFVARLLIGAGSAFGFVGLMVMTLNWFPKKYFAFLLGWGQLLGAIGPLVAGGPVALVLKAVDGNWRLIFLSVALFGVGLTVLIALFLKGKPTSDETVIFVDRYAPLSKRLKSLLTRSQIWWIVIFSATVYFSMPLLGAIWGTSYLTTRGFEKSTAAFILSMIWIGLAVGSPLLGRLSDQVKRRKPFVALCSMIGIITSITLLYIPITNQLALGFLFFLIGFAGSGQNLSFAMIAENAPKSLRATALGLNNTIIMGFAAIMSPCITAIMKLFTQGGPLTEQAFTKGLSIVPICFAIALLVSLFGLRETFCKQQNTVHRLEP